MLYLKFKNAIRSLFAPRLYGQGLIEYTIILGLVLVVVTVIVSIALSVLEIESVQDGFRWLLENGSTN